MPVVSPVNTSSVPVSEVEQAAGVVTDGYGVTVYPVSAEPPLTVGPSTRWWPRWPRWWPRRSPRSAPRVVPTVIELDGADAGPVPLAFLAVTVKV